MTGQLPATPKCLSCKRDLDGWARPNGDDNKPAVGDLSICAYCGNVAKFGLGFAMVPLTDADMIESAGSKELIDAVNARSGFPVS